MYSGFIQSLIAISLVQVSLSSTAMDSNEIVQNNLTLLEQICDMFNISTMDCNCHRLPQFCNQEDFQINKSKVNKSTKTSTAIYTSISLITNSFGMVGNALVLLVASRQKTYLQSGQLHIAELSAVNFVFCALQLINVIPLYWTKMWIYGIPGCKIVRSSMELASFATIGFIMIIAVERYLLVTYPLMRKYIEKRYRHSLVIGNVLLGAATVIPFMIGLNVDADGRCVAFHKTTSRMALPYNIFVIIMYSVLPVVITSIMYIKIVRQFSTQRSDENLVAAQPNQQRARVGKDRHIILITILTLVAFVVCTLPTRVISTSILLVVTFHDNDLYMALVFLTYVMYPLQSTLNPILYSMVAKTWRRDMRVLTLSGRSRIIQFVRRHLWNGEKLDETSI